MYWIKLILTLWFGPAVKFCPQFIRIIKRQQQILSATACGPSDPWGVLTSQQTAQSVSPAVFSLSLTEVWSACMQMDLYHFIPCFISKSFGPFYLLCFWVTSVFLWWPLLQGYKHRQPLEKTSSYMHFNTAEGSLLTVKHCIPITILLCYWVTQLSLGRFSSLSIYTLYFS